MSTPIVITGEGIVSAIGLNKANVLDSLREGKTGIAKMRYLNSEHSELPVGEVKLTNEEMQQRLHISEKYVSRTAMMGMMAIEEAIADAGLEGISKESYRVVLVSGTTVGGMDITERYFKDLQTSDEHLPCLKQHDCGSSTEAMADRFSYISDYTTISTACSSAANAIILGANLIKSGQADIVIAGGSEALSRFHLNGFNTLMILDSNLCRPFDATRMGLNLGEGAGFVVMEREDCAMRRKAAIHAYLTGYGNACDAFHQTASSENGEGAYRAMVEAMEMANISPSDINYINAHGTGTPNNDRSESAAIKRVFGENIPDVSSTKSLTGHTTSASGGIEAVISILALQHSFVPGNIGWRHSEEGVITPSMGKSDCSMNNVLCNSFGFGGNDSALIFSKRSTSKEAKHDKKKTRIASKIVIDDIESLAEIKEYVKPLEARRMGKLMKAAILSSMKALKAAGIDKPDAIVTGTSMGCLENSEKFLVQMCNDGETTLSPTLFMQSTHNTISSMIAIRLGCHGYNITYSQGERSLDWAIHDAELLIASGKAKSVLVGYHDETTETFNSLMERSGQSTGQPKVNSVAMVLVCGD